MSANECVRCGLAACDLPDIISENPDSVDSFFEGGLCIGCQMLEDR